MRKSKVLTLTVRIVKDKLLDFIKLREQMAMHYIVHYFHLAPRMVPKRAPIYRCLRSRSRPRPLWPRIIQASSPEQPITSPPLPPPMNVVWGGRSLDRDLKTPAENCPKAESRNSDEAMMDPLAGPFTFGKVEEYSAPI